jgi:putative transposase
MARSRYHFYPGDPNPYFITATTVDWLPLFREPEITGILIDSLRFLIQNKRLALHAYVIMTDHLHLVASGEDLSRQMANFKSFTARKIIDYYQEQQNQAVLEKLALLKLAHKTESDYQLWQEGSHPERIKDEEMLAQKVEYIHFNPVRKGFVDGPELWRLSSAGDYAGKVGLLPLRVCM